MLETRKACAEQVNKANEVLREFKQIELWADSAEEQIGKSLEVLETILTSIDLPAPQIETDLRSLCRVCVGTNQSEIECFRELIVSFSKQLNIIFFFQIAVCSKFQIFF